MEIHGILKGYDNQNSRDVIDVECIGDGGCSPESPRFLDPEVGWQGIFVIDVASKKVVLEDLYEEVSNVLTLEEFEELYDKATEEHYGSLIIDCSHKDKRFMRGLDTQLLIK